MVSIFNEAVREAVNDIAILLGIIIAFTTVVKFPYKKFVAWLAGKESQHLHAQHIINDVIPQLVESHAGMDDQLKFIIAELKPNHGTSLRDAVNRLEKNLAEHGALLRAWWSQDAKPMYITDAEGKMTWCNRSYTEFTQRSVPELLGLGYLNIVEPSQREQVREEAKAAVEDKRDVVMYFNVVVPDTWESNNGEPYLVPVEATAVPIIEKGDLTGYIGSLRRLDEH